MRNLSKNGLSMSQAQSISNLCNQAAQEITNKISSFNVCSKTIKVNGDTHFLQEANSIPNDIISLLQTKGKLHATQAFLMEAIKAKETEISRLKRTLPSFDHLVEPVCKEQEPLEFEDSVNEEWGWNQLSDAEYSEFLEAEAYASHLGQFIHKNGKLSEMRKEVSTLPSIEWIEVEIGKKTPVKITKHHTSEELHNYYEKIAALHRSSEQRVNYFKAKVKNLVSDENAAIQKRNADKSAEYYSIEKQNREQYLLELQAYEADKTAIVLDYNSKRELAIKDAAALRISVDPRFQDVIDTFLKVEI